MNKAEFERAYGREVSREEYREIERVYLASDYLDHRDFVAAYIDYQGDLAMLAALGKPVEKVRKPRKPREFVTQAAVKRLVAAYHRARSYSWELQEVAAMIELLSIKAGYVWEIDNLPKIVKEEKVYNVIEGEVVRCIDIDSIGQVMRGYTQNNPDLVHYYDTNGLAVVTIRDFNRLIDIVAAKVA